MQVFGIITLIVFLGINNQKDPLNRVEVLEELHIGKDKWESLKVLKNGGLPKTSLLHRLYLFKPSEPKSLLTKLDKKCIDRLSPQRSLKSLVQDYTLKDWEGNC
ncbi:hypothetical protein SADUNF_Sadunf04G0117100 [Salix dunnii]|uniref:Uncharacterized protein n=1 Tax=Salix dunnii TaxID=1413687 RepID=A0A835N2X3_9ROSI|nr:hypothetical protein SADUNF_Sadunf04G0117100 [Salix dunnii]